MGCVQAKSSMNSPSRELEKLKLENGYVCKKEILTARIRSTTEERSSNDRVSDVKLINEVKRSSGESRFTSDENLKEVVYEDGMTRDDEVADGWPKWLTDNIPAQVLSGLVPKSAESFDMISKVRTIMCFFGFIFDSKT